MILFKFIKLGLFCAFLSACTGKPFQPPPMFKMFEKKNATTENVKDGLNNSTPIEVASR